MYPILADVGYFSASDLDSICKRGSSLGAIPDPVVPGFETANGSLGHGLGVACGMALALSRKRSEIWVYVMMGDGELYEGAVWEAIMFAGHHKLDRLILIVDSNTRCMLNFSRQVIDIFPLKGKFAEFGWRVEEADGHSVGDLYSKLSILKKERQGRPSVLIANTVKGHGVPSLERDPVCHVKSLSPQEVDSLLERTQDDAHG
jgi:transketolase